MKAKKAVAFAGLADNDQFFTSLEQAGLMLEHTFAFADHHSYADSDVDRIVATALDKGAEVLVTTFKDFVKIENDGRWPMELVAVDVNIKLIKDENIFRDTLSETLNLT